MEPILVKLQRPMAVNLRLEANLVGQGEGLRRHEALLTALETNDRDLVLEALRDHGGQRYLQFREEAASVVAGR
jgi:DNA-binding GntR family transcriptional regulator